MTRLNFSSEGLELTFSLEGAACCCVELANEHTAGDRRHWFVGSHSVEYLMFGPNPDTSIIDLIFDSIAVHGWIPEQAPDLPHLPAHFCRDNLKGISIEQKTSGFVANIHFTTAPEGQPDKVGTADQTPLSLEDALLSISSILTEIVTGEKREPFFFSGKQMICVAYEAQLSPWVPPWRK